MVPNILVPRKPFMTEQDNRKKGPDKPKILGEGKVGEYLENAGLFSGITPQGREPISYPIAEMDKLDERLAEQIRRQQSAQEKDKLRAQRESLRRISMAYQVLVHPLLDEAGKRFANNPDRLPLEHGAASYRMIIEEQARDAQARPDLNTHEFPHRSPVRLTDQEHFSLVHMAAVRGVPFDPDRREYRYTDLIPQMDARNREAIDRFYAEHGQRMIDEGYLRPRSQIAEEIAKRQEKWREPDQQPPKTNPSSDPKPR